MATHADGSDFPDGTSRVPRAFAPCCEAFGLHTTSCFFDLRLEWWFIVIAPIAGGGGLQITYCPFCGRLIERS